MKNKVFRILLILLLGITLVSGCSVGKLKKIKVRLLDSSGTAGYFEEITLKEKNFNLPDIAMVYKVVKKNMSKTDAINISKKFNVSGRVSEIRDTIVIRGENGDVFVDKNTGSYKYFSRKIKENTQDKGKYICTG